MTELDAIACWAVFGAVLALVIQYWVVRLAVRGGIQDATRRQRTRAAAPPVWNLQQPTPEAGTGPQEESGT